MNALRTLAVLLLALSACGPLEEPGVADDTGGAEASISLPVPSEDRPDTVDVVSWNVEWFGDPANGPSNEARQQANVARALAELNADLVGLVEVVSPQAFAGVVAKLPGYRGLLVTEPQVANGAAFYSAGEQKVGLVFRDRFTVDSARLVLIEAQWAFGGRPPMEVKLSFVEGGKPRTLVVLVAHFKAMANADGYERRLASAAALKQFLDAEYPTRWVLLVGDLNDGLIDSTYRGHASPFAALASDPHYRFTTDSLSAAHVPTTVGFGSTIDHHLVTDDLAKRFVEGSAKVLRLDQYLTSYGTSTSDHYPVLTRYDLR